MLAGGGGVSRPICARWGDPVMLSMAFTQTQQSEFFRRFSSTVQRNSNWDLGSRSATLKKNNVLMNLSKPKLNLSGWKNFQSKREER